MSLPLVAVVGRPNVGKSTLFNKLCGSRLSIVDNTPGVTRDRIYAKCEWLGHEFMLVDTGGIEPNSNDIILSQMRRQAQLAIDNADVIILVTDIRCGVTANDADVAAMLLKSGKPILLCVNKCDTLGEPPMELYEFYNLGLGEPYPVSAEHGHGSGDLLDAVLEHLPGDADSNDDDGAIRVAVIGKPNAGKSSLINKICGEERMIVSDIAGTTRDATDTAVENEFGSYIFIDTAGLRKKARVIENIERYSALKAYMAVDRADVCVIMLDAQTGFTEQDSKIAGYAHEQGKACIVAVNKWDVIEKDDKTMIEFTEKLRQDLSFMSYVQFVFISALTGQRITRLFDEINKAYAANHIRLTTGVLNDVLSYATTRVQPPTDKGKALKLYYITQPSSAPPTFVIFVNNAELFHFSYQRYIENQLRSSFSLNGTPIRLVIRERGKNSD